MKFDSASEVDQICYQFKLADWPRSRNRARINELFNGVPPYTDEEVNANNININVNDLSGTRLAHDARSQFYGAFLKPGNYFTLTTDSGPKHKRRDYNTIVTKEMNRIMKRSIPYFECFRSKFATDVLHGIAPAIFRDGEHWCPEPVGVDDVMVPANTVLTMNNLPFYAVYRPFTAMELIKMTSGPKVDPAWNMPLVKACLEWVDSQTLTLSGDRWPEVWSPEKLAERQKSDGGIYASDQVPVINTWDFYFWNDDKNQAGWNRRMVIDAWSTPSMQGNAAVSSRLSGKPFDKDFKNQFLYNPGKKVWAAKREQIINWQFADLSSVAPFRYHSVRSLGFLLYSVCHLQNRLRCKFNEAIFEQLMVYFRVNSADDMQRALKVDMINRGFIDSTIEFVKPADRYQVNTNLVELGLMENNRLITQNSSSYTASPQGSGAQNNVEKTKFQVMAETNAMTSLVSASLLQAYAYQVPEYREISRRFFRDNSDDPDVRTFQANCLRQGVPKSLFDVERWDCEPERVMGAGNKTLEMAIAQQLMQFRNLYDPEPQRQILRDVTLAITDDPARADALVPESPQKVTDSIHDAQLAAASLMLGLPVAIKTGMNHIEYVDSLMTSMAIIIKRIMTADGGVTTADNILGLQNMAANIGEHIRIIAQDKAEKARVKQYGDQLGKLMNQVKAFAQRLQEQMQQQAAQGPQMDPETMAKIQAITATAQVKADNTKQAHAQRTAQRQIQFEMSEKQKEQTHQLNMKIKAQEAELDLLKEKLKLEQKKNSTLTKSESS